MSGKVLAFVIAFLSFALVSVAAAAPGDYEKALTKALNAHDKASATFYQGVEKATTEPGTTPEAAFTRLIPVYETFLTATDVLVDSILDVTAPKDLKKVHKALLISKLRLSDGLSDQIEAFKSKDPAKMEDATKRLNAMGMLSVRELQRQIESAGYDFEKFVKENVLLKKG